MTTPITDVPTACADLWAPYQVTKVPPVDVLEQEHVPAAPPVRNMTNGAVSDADAQRWANASNRGSGWFKWAEANGQISLLRHLLGPAVINQREVDAMAAGALITQPDCNLYPGRNSLFEMQPDGRAYFTRKHLPSGEPFVFVVTSQPGPCASIFAYPDGHTDTIEDFTKPVDAFEPGHIVADPVLGDIWFTDAGGNCQDPEGPPPEWCGR